jgi:hypothetical protein
MKIWQIFMKTSIFAKIGFAKSRHLVTCNSVAQSAPPLCPHFMLSVSQWFLCPFAVYYLRYAVRSFFTMSRISLADDKRAGQKVHRKIAAAVQKVKSPLFFVPLF